MQKQSELIKQLSDRELMKQVIVTQLLLAGASLVLSLVFFGNMNVWLDLFHMQVYEMAYYGLLTGVIIVIVDLFLMAIFPKTYYDDGGVNERLFHNRSILGIFGLALAAAVSEELLFRGVIQTTFGYVIASVLFAVIHIRYLTKPVLFISVLMVSFYIGYMFDITKNLAVVILAHFTVDFVLGLIIRFRKGGGRVAHRNKR
ncbi:CPBP family intramembrane metalloprotease [Lentibacillus halophilus]|uniref:CPBP family intramembrane metalloprotease n=1 Tax=Lentibacillus halophilus TaxID=295065 RepID=A0ABN0ZDT8_9BACI